MNAAQVEDSLMRVDGMLLLMGVLHGLNVLSLPVVGRAVTKRKTSSSGAVQAKSPSVPTM